MIGMATLLAILILLVWTVHLHRLRTGSETTSLGLSSDTVSWALTRHGGAAT